MDEAIATVSARPAPTPTTPSWRRLWRSGPWTTWKRPCPSWCPSSRSWTAGSRRSTPTQGLAIMDENDLVHMAHMDIHYGFSVNGVASLHTEILENSELKAFARPLPGEVQQQDQRHHLPPVADALQPRPAAFITEHIGAGWKQDANQLEKLLRLPGRRGDPAQLLDIKQQNKRQLAPVPEGEGRGGDRHPRPSSTSRSSACTSTSASR